MERTDKAAGVDAVDAAAQLVAGQQRPVEGVRARRAGQRGARLELLLRAAQRQQAVARGVLLRQQKCSTCQRGVSLSAGRQPSLGMIAKQAHGWRFDRVADFHTALLSHLSMQHAAAEWDMLCGT